MIPFQAKSVYKLRQRYHKALEKIWIAEPDMEDRPSGHREHVFDFNNGLRLIISRDILAPDDKPKIHISASWFTKPNIPLDKWVDEIRRCFRLLDRRNVTWLFVGISPKGIPHWILEDVN